MFPAISRSTNHFEILEPSDISRIDLFSRGWRGPVKGERSRRLDREIYEEHAGFPTAAGARPNELVWLLDDWFRARFQVVSLPEW